MPPQADPEKSSLLPLRPDWRRHLLSTRTRLPAPYHHHYSRPSHPQSSTRRTYIISFISVTSIILLLHVFNPVRYIDHYHRHHHPHYSPHHTFNTPQCPQIPPLGASVTTETLKDTEEYISSKEYRNVSATYLSEAIQIPTVMYDGMKPIGSDARWDVFPEFLRWVEGNFPLLHAKKEVGVHRVNTLNMLYVWKGSDESLKPTLLMAHYDVVPVEPSTLNMWTHPPFSGYIDNFDGGEKEYIWGRGSSDDKNRLIAIFESVELLIKAGFTPKRTLILSFGCSEESNSDQGAAKLAPYIEKLYPGGVEVVIDEGGGIIADYDMGWAAERTKDTKTFMLAATGEKGYTDIIYTLRLPGGHSSVPPDRTAIGIVGELAAMVEEHPFTPYIAEENPFIGSLNCGAEHALGFPKDIKRMLDKEDWEALEHKLYQEEQSRYLITTSSATTVIRGGVKANALPESVTLNVNVRINIGETIEDIKEHYLEMANTLAKKHNITVVPYGLQALCEGVERCLHVGTSDHLDVAPVSPTTLHTDDGKLTAWGVLVGATRAVFGEDVIVSPGLMSGNTDTRYYWGLSKAIYRVSPVDVSKEGLEAAESIHTVNERSSIDAHVDTVKWFWTFIRVMDETDIA